MRYLSCIVVAATLAAIIAGCGDQSSYEFSSPRYTPGYTPSGHSYAYRRDPDRSYGIQPGPERANI